MHQMGIAMQIDLCILSKSVSLTVTLEYSSIYQL